jgi:putative membrane protein
MRPDQVAPARRGQVTFGLGVVLSVCAVAGLAAAQPMSAQDFVNAAGQSDAYEIAAGQVMLTQSKNAAVRVFAQQMIEDHRKTSADLTAAATQSNLESPPLIVGGDMQRLLSALQSQKGEDLDRSFITQQVNAHTAALVTEQGYIGAGTDPNLRRAAQRAVPTIEHHLEMAKRMGAAPPAN